MRGEGKATPRGGSVSTIFSRSRLGETVKSQRVSRGTRRRVHLTGGNRPYRPGPVTVPAGYQPVGSKNFEFEFQKLKIIEKIPKNTS
jgi:hypothetical protein